MRTLGPKSINPILLGRPTNRPMTPSSMHGRPLESHLAGLGREQGSPKKPTPATDKQFQMSQVRCWEAARNPQQSGFGDFPPGVHYIPGSNVTSFRFRFLCQTPRGMEELSPGCQCRGHALSKVNS